VVVFGCGGRRDYTVKRLALVLLLALGACMNPDYDPNRPPDAIGQWLINGGGRYIPPPAPVYRQPMTCVRVGNMLHCN
jgi:hypothetical protein